jgi:hypothetical protein
VTITISDLRSYAAETASADVATAAGDRAINNWINKALKRIWKGHSWTHAQRDGRVFLPVEEASTAVAGAGVTLTQGSRLITVGAPDVIKQKYLDERWHLYIDGEGRITFELEEILTPTTARLKEGHNWPNADLALGAYTWARHIFPLPDNAKEVMRVEEMQNRLPLRYVQPHDFDPQRQSTPTTRGNQPIFYTLRQGDMEVWPASGPDPKNLLLSYRRGPPRHKTTDPGDTVVDWVPEWDDLLLKGIDLEASVSQGENAPIPYQVALNEFVSCLKSYKAEDSGIQSLTGPMHLMTGKSASDYQRVTNYPAQIPEVG